MPRSIPADTKYMYTAVVYKVGAAGSVRRFGPYRLEKTAWEQVTRWKKGRHSMGSPVAGGHVERVEMRWERMLPAYWTTSVSAG